MTLETSMQNIDITCHFNDFTHATQVLAFYRAYCNFVGHHLRLNDMSPLRKAIPGGWEPEKPAVHLRSRPNNREEHTPLSGAI